MYYAWRPDAHHRMDVGRIVRPPARRAGLELLGRGATFGSRQPSIALGLRRDPAPRPSAMSLPPMSLPRASTWRDLLFLRRASLKKVDEAADRGRDDQRRQENRDRRWNKSKILNDAHDCRSPGLRTKLAALTHVMLPGARSDAGASPGLDMRPARGWPSTTTIGDRLFATRATRSIACNRGSNPRNHLSAWKRSIKL